jgi:energy-converting hydrogenase Eha subunit E
MKIALEDNLQGTIFAINGRRTSDKMCALLIEVFDSPLVAVISIFLYYNHPFQLISTSVSTSFDTRRIETRGVVLVFLDFLIDLDYF